MLVRSWSGPVRSQLKLGRTDRHRSGLGPVQSGSDSTWDEPIGIGPVSVQFSPVRSSVRSFGTILVPCLLPGFSNRHSKVIFTITRTSPAGAGGAAGQIRPQLFLESPWNSKTYSAEDLVFRMSEKFQQWVL